MANLTQRADLLVDDKPYMIVRTADHAGARGWQETSPAGAEIGRGRRDTAREDTGEVRISFESKHRGFGEPISITEGRDYWGQNVDKRYPRQVTLSRAITSISTSSYTAGADPAGIVELGGYIYLAMGRYILKIDQGSDTISSDIDLNTISVGAQAKSLAVFKSKMYVALGENLAFRQTTGNGTYTAQADGLKATLFQVAEHRMYRIHSVSTSAASYLSNVQNDPMEDADWSASDPIGDTSVAATGMTNLAYQLFIAKEDGLYAADIETGRFPSITPELKPWRHSNNGRGIKGWGGLVLMPTIRGLKLYFGGQLYTAGPEVMSQNDSEVSGRITAIAGDANWVYAAVYNGTNSYVLAGRVARPDDQYPGEMLWHVVWYETGGPFTAMEVTGVNNEPRLWFASQTELKYVKLGSGLDNPLQDSTATYSSTATDYYPAHDAGSPMVDKHFLELRVYAEHLSPTQYITWYYRLDDDTDWTLLGVTRESPVEVLKFDQAMEPLGRRVALKAVWTRGATTTSTPIVRNVEVLSVEYPPNRKVLQAAVLLADNVQLRSGSDSRTTQQMVRDLDKMFADRRRVRLMDPVGRIQTALPIGSPTYKEAMQTDTRSPVLVATLQFLVLP